LYGRYLKDFKFQNSEYRGHQVSPKVSGSQNFSFLAFKGEAVGVAKIYANGNGNGNGA
jgi:NOL1/NOP2/fmu family ribosome biogenesis protein